MRVQSVIRLSNRRAHMMTVSEYRGDRGESSKEVRFCLKFENLKYEPFFI